MFNRKPCPTTPHRPTAAARPCCYAVWPCHSFVSMYPPSAATAQPTDQQSLVRVLRGSLSEDQPAFSRVVATGVVNAVGTEQFDADVPGDDASRQTFYFREGTISTRALDAEAGTFTAPTHGAAR